MANASAASVAGLKAGASGHPYGASKAGVISLVQTTAYSLSGTGVRINATRAVSVSGSTPPKASALAGAAWY